MTKMTLTVAMTVISDPVTDTVLLMPGKWWLLLIVIIYCTRSQLSQSQKGMVQLLKFWYRSISLDNKKCIDHMIILFYWKKNNELFVKICLYEVIAIQYICTAHISIQKEVLLELFFISVDKCIVHVFRI